MIFFYSTILYKICELACLITVLQIEPENYEIFGLL